MQEFFLHYVWQYQYFDRQALQTACGQELVIYDVGFSNSHAGADFFDAKIKIGSIKWVGSVEIHVQSSDWERHQHDQDKAYDNVILHVVWKANKKNVRKDGSIIPTLELQKRVSNELINKYSQLVNSPQSIPCHSNLKRVNDLVKSSMLDQALTKRLENKANDVVQLLKKNTGNWEETTYQWLAKSFGFKINAEPFLQLAKSLPYKLIQKQISDPLQIEALFFGQAGMLAIESSDPYLISLLKEYRFLAKKYSLENTGLHFSQWKFLRLRPANFPTLRIAQFVSFLLRHPSLFTTIKEIESITNLIDLFQCSPSNYWRNHYHFQKKSDSNIPGIGKSSKENLLINGIVPVLVAYGKQIDDSHYLDRAVELLQVIPAEKNHITKKWEAWGVKVNTSFDSQALVEQYTNMCKKRFCLNCVIGASIIR